MTCNCKEEVNTKLKSKNARIKELFMFDIESDNPDMVSKLYLPLEQLEKGRGRPKAPASITFPHCPFCGIKYD